MLRHLKTWLQGKDFPVKPMDGASKRKNDVDPRELPRPLRLPSSDNAKIISFIREDGDVAHVAEQPVTTDSREPPACQCPNCQVLFEEFAECPVCTEPLVKSSTIPRQEIGVRSCQVCGNIVCKSCSMRLWTCAFCRAPLTTTPNNVALERLLTKLTLPCRNSRNGCPAILTREERDAHELTCRHSTETMTLCPLHKFCNWNGKSSELIAHLKGAHELNIVPANGINIEICDLRAKLVSTANKSRRYSISLSCHGKIFICKVILHGNVLKLSFVQVNETRCDEGMVDARIFGAWVEVKSSMKTIKGILPISSHRNMKTLDVPCQALLSPTGRDRDLVKIAITIRSM